MPRTPCIGDVVLYQAYGTPAKPEEEAKYLPGPRAATVTNVNAAGDQVSIAVHTPHGTFYNHDLSYSREPQGGTWRWPEPAREAGAAVRYVLPDEARYPGEVRGAVITRAWGPETGYTRGEVNLLVFADGSNDGPRYAAGPAWATSAPYDPDKAPGTWHWPND